MASPNSIQLPRHSKLKRTKRRRMRRKMFLFQFGNSDKSRFITRNCGHIFTPQRALKRSPWPPPPAIINNRRFSIAVLHRRMSKNKYRFCAASAALLVYKMVSVFRLSATFAIAAAATASGHSKKNRRRRAAIAASVADRPL